MNDMPDFEGEFKVKLRWYIEKFPSPHPFFAHAMAALEKKEAEEGREIHQPRTIYIQSSNVANLNLGSQAGTITTSNTKELIQASAFPRCPNLSGRWEGWSFRTLAKEWRAAAQEFIHHNEGIVANAWGPKNWARGLCAAIVSDGATHRLIWSYITESTSQGRPGDVHMGTHFFKYSERDGRKYLEGKYVTDRLHEDGKTVGSVGFHRLVWVSNERKSDLGFADEAHWGMAKPLDEP